MAEWIANLYTVEAEMKVRQLHDVTGDEVREAVCWGKDEGQAWHDHPGYGRRLVVKGTTYDGRPLIAYLRPYGTEQGDWELLTAYDRT